MRYGKVKRKSTEVRYTYLRADSAHFSVLTEVKRDCAEVADLDTSEEAYCDR